MSCGDAAAQMIDRLVRAEVVLSKGSWDLPQAIVSAHRHGITHKAILDRCRGSGV